MGLAEKRAVEGIKNGDYKTFVNDVKNIVSYDLSVDVDWTTVENHRECAWIVENNKVQSLWFDNLLSALKSVAVDEMGKNALKEKLKSIVFVNAEGYLTFDNGVFTIPSSLDGNGVYGADSIQAFLEGQL